MKRDTWFGLALWTLAASVGAIAFPDLIAPIASAWTLIVSSRLVLELEDSAYALTRTERTFEDAIRVRESRRVRPPDLVRLESTLGWGTYDPREFDHHVRPILRQLIVHRSRRADRIDNELARLAGTETSDSIYGRRLETADLERIAEKIGRS